jgi:Bacterial cellulose synthase subunit
LKINQLPIGSVRLDNENINGGVLTTRIPVSELQKSVWQLDLEAYHDLGTVADCTRSFEEVAWTVVEKSSLFSLSTGLLNGHPYLEDFPYLVGKDGVAAPKLTIALSANPTDTELSAAAVIAARASQKNRHPYDWDVLNGTIPDSKASSLAIGYYDEVSRFANIAKDLLVAPTGAHTFKIDPRIRVMSSSLEGGAVLQAVRSPGSDTGVLYVLLAADDAALRRFTEVLTNPKRVSQLRDEVVVLNADGTIVPFSTVSELASDEKATAEKDRFTPQMTAVWIGLFAAVILLIIFVGSKFRKRTPR